MNKAITITEHEEIYVGKVIGGEAITAEQFYCLENFVSANSDSGGTQNSVMQLANRQGRKVIIPKQYVGTIVLADGTNIEILPKIYGSSGSIVGKDTARQIFKDMQSASENAAIILNGGEYAKAQLFDMGCLFENYIEKAVLQYLQSNKLPYSLCSEAQNISISPDIVIIDNDNGSTYLIDTKWKLLSEIETEGGVSQSDMYQMYAYFKEYEALDKNPQNITLIYPYAGSKFEKGTAGIGKTQIIKQAYEEFYQKKHKELLFFDDITDGDTISSYKPLDNIIKNIKTRKANNAVIAAATGYCSKFQISQQTLLDLLDILYFVGDFEESWNYIKDKYIQDENTPALRRFLADSAVTAADMEQISRTNSYAEGIISTMAKFERRCNQYGGWAKAFPCDPKGELALVSLGLGSGILEYVGIKRNNNGEPTNERGLLAAFIQFLVDIGCSYYKNNR